MAESRTSILQRFRQKIAEGRPIIGGGAGTGISAKFEEAGGIDLIVIYNSGRFRMAGHSSLCGLLPFGDANTTVLQMAAEVLPVVQHTPVLAGVCATDPMRRMEQFLVELRALGFAGVQNFPTVGLFDGTFRANLEETNLGYQREVEMIRLAHEMDLLTTPYVFNPDEAVRMTKAGADLIVAHMGLTTSGSIGARTARTLQECVGLIDQIVQAARQVRPDVIALCHGGPIAEPQDAQFILQHCPGVDGFYGASSMERLPTERAIRQQTELFTRIRRQS
ncbi:MAG: phosphoenolpyruvate hydrolase family protein [Thermoguttaceae bacterium]